jgi:uncharacterized protein involved in exopolysaccharide biosynthesis
VNRSVPGDPGKSPSTPVSQVGGSGGTLVDLALMYLRQGKWVVWFPVSLAILVVAVGLLVPRRYSAVATFLPRSSSASLSRLAGLASQLGVTLPTAETNESPDFYADLLRSGHILRQLVWSRFDIAEQEGSNPATLVELYRVRGRDSAQREERAVRRLSRDLRVSVNPKTGTVAFSVTTGNARLSRDVVARALDLILQFNVETRQSRAGAERRFVEGRLAAARTELREIEDRLQAWLQDNRDYSGSPRLRFEYERMQRTLGLKQTLVTSLAQTYEQSRIEEVRDTPVLTVVDEPVIPSRPNSRRLAVKGILAMMAGGLFTLVWAAAREALARASKEQPLMIDEIRRRARSLLLLRGSRVS